MPPQCQQQARFSAPGRCHGRCAAAPARTAAAAGGPGSRGAIQEAGLTHWFSVIGDDALALRRRQQQLAPGGLQALRQARLPLVDNLYRVGLQSVFPAAPTWRPHIPRTGPAASDPRRRAGRDQPGGHRGVAKLQLLQRRKRIVLAQPGRDVQILSQRVGGQGQRVQDAGLAVLERYLYALPPWQGSTDANSRFRSGPTISRV